MNKVEYYDILFSDAFINSTIFIVGFFLGTFMDALFYTIYLQIDPDEKSLSKLLLVFTVQVYLMILLFTFASTLPFLQDVSLAIFRFAIMSSQIFMMEYAMGRITNSIFHRKIPVGKTKTPFLFKL